jgi:cytosine/adenosine deaminase-related metal-dependent hydrolase
LQELGYNICLGTDSLASNGSLSLFAEMQALSNAHPWLAPKQILEMATVNGARALGQSTNLGKIRSGLQADLIAVPIGEQSREVFETIMACDRPVPWSMVGGRPVDRVRSVAPVFSQS